LTIYPTEVNISYYLEFVQTLFPLDSTKNIIGGYVMAISETKYTRLLKLLKTHIPESRLITNDLLLRAYSIDASVYRLIPKLVIIADNENEISFILKKCNDLTIPVTFRAAGTSLSGQALTDSVLIKLSANWVSAEVLNNGKTIQLQPGVIGARANRFLSSFGKKIGPDPASIDAAMIGGIAANNASGMCCGTTENSYQTLSGLKLVFANGEILNTENIESRTAFKSNNKVLLNQLKEIGNRIKNNPDAAEKIKNKFKIKNTTGYAVNSFIDFSDPIDILQHLIIGSEGTLAFISSITYNTVVDYRYKSCCLLFFNTAEEALETIPLLIKRNIAVGELMDYMSLKSVKDKPGMPEYLQNIGDGVVALLTEVKADDYETMQREILVLKEDLKQLKIVFSSGFTNNSDDYKLLWKIRKGLLPTVGAIRNQGTTLIIEDIAFPPKYLSPGFTGLRKTLIKHGYEDAIIFGHALAGNLHFVFTQDFDDTKEVARYSAFIEELTTMVVEDYNGSLKAEHGTGRNMAPFVEMEWGEFIYKIMEDIKTAFDPKHILNPGVILNSDKDIHLKNFKSTPVTNDIIDKCIECGYCEPRCPSAELTFTPRQRIRAWRDIISAKNIGNKNKLYKEYEKTFNYYGEATCAADGLCAVRCPIDIDTGSLVKYLRETKTTALGRYIAQFIADHLKAVVSILRNILKLELFAYKVFGFSALRGITKLMYYATFKKMPLWGDFMPGPSLFSLKQKGIIKKDSPKIVYFPTCLTRAMGPAVKENKKASMIDTTMEVLGKMGYEVFFPDNLGNLCCGMPWASKGYKKQGQQKLNELTEALFKISANGKIPVICDASPCAARIKEAVGDRMEMMDQIDFIDKYIVDKVSLEQQNKTIALHSTCTVIKGELAEKLKNIARICAKEVIISEDVECCGFAGDRGFSYPELNKSALRALRPSLPEHCHEGISTSKSCEIGLSREGGINYNSLMYLVNDSMENDYME
jgi:D-lactate dehydrogenase